MNLSIADERAAAWFAGAEPGDWNTPVAPARALEAWNASTGHLPITFQNYQRGHAGNKAARSEMSQLLASLISD